MSETPAQYNGRRGDWMTTFTGRRFWPLDPRPGDVVIEDVAHALSMLCRFAGHCRTFYSVAQHSILVSYTCDPGDELAGLLHDAAEAYVIDVPRPLKRDACMAAYRDAEEVVHAAIGQRFGLASGIPASVKVADEIVLATEARDLMDTRTCPWVNLDGVLKLDQRIRTWSPELAESLFLARFAELSQ